MTQMQHTPRASCRFDGVALHSGKKVTMLLEPAEVDFGIRFVRDDLPGAKPIAAIASNVTSTVLSTTLGPSDTGFSTIEHVMAALFSMGVDNALVRLSGPETPIADGSSGPFADAIASVGLREQSAKRVAWKLVKPISVRRGNSLVEASPNDVPVIDNLVEYPVSCIGRQRVVYRFGIDEFSRLCDARTFCLRQDIDAMRARGLAQGGSLDNAVVASEEGILNPDGLRYPDEAVRHKTLDAIGDFALLGAPLIAAFRIEFGGHALHVDLIRQILDNRDALLAPVEMAAGPWTETIVARPWRFRSSRLSQH